MLIDVYGPNLSHDATPDGSTFAVHAAGCQHGYRPLLLHATKRTEEHPSLVALCDDYYPPSDFDCESGEYVGEFYIAPCARALPDA